MKLRYRIAAFIIRTVWKLFFGFRIEGIENIPPKGRLIVAANHRSNYDPPLIGAAAAIRRELFYFAKLGLFTPSKWFAWLIRSFNAYPVDTRKFDLPALRKTGHLLERELGLLYFPEGTRNRTPLDFFARQTQSRLYCQAIQGTHIANPHHRYKYTIVAVSPTSW